MYRLRQQAMPYRRRRSPKRSLGTVIQSYKKVLNHAPTSRAAATDHLTLLTRGQDSVAAGQTTATDANIPTGALVKYIEIQYSSVNLVAVASFLHWAIIRTHSGQTAPSSNAVGGDPLRNQVHLQGMYTMGQNQNSNRTIRFKVPKKFQRVRDGDSWFFSKTCDTVFSDSVQVIYKFYR